MPSERVLSYEEAAAVVRAQAEFALGWPRITECVALAAAVGRVLAEAVTAKALGWFRGDAGYPARFEPSGHDFLSPALTQAELMSRLLPAGEFSALHHAQAAIARDHGLPDWAALKLYIADAQQPSHALSQLRWLLSRFSAAGRPSASKASRSRTLANQLRSLTRSTSFSSSSA